MLQPASAWEMSFTLPAGDSLCAHVDAASGRVLDLSVQEKTLHAVFHTQWKCDTPRYGAQPAFDFELTAPAAGGNVRLVWLGHLCQLYVNDELMDEEWPLGELPEGPWDVSGAQCTLSPATVSGEHAEKQLSFPSAEFVLEGSNTFIGDCMPFARDGKYCLYYLFDRRHHRSKQGLGAHQWAQMSTSDLKTWTSHPLAVAVTEQWEGSICTGSLLEAKGKVYAFYAVRMSDGSPALMTWAVSEDGVHFEKSGKTFALTAPYEPVSARDPMVFLGADGQYHMLVTTSMADGGLYGGCLAHLTSPDLENWTQHEPFIVPGYADQPECSDYFEWNGWYYLVFSNFAAARYRMSRSPFGPWIRPEFDELDAHDIHVPKTAAFRNRRLMSGFLSTQRYLYAGTAITHELFQRPDGTLGAKHVPELLPAFSSEKAMADIELHAGDGRAEALLADHQQSLRLRCRLEAGLGVMTGLALRFGSEENGFRLSFHNGSVRLLNPDQRDLDSDGRMPLTGLCMQEGTAVELVLRGDVLDVAVGDGRMITCRLERPANEPVSLAFYAQAGDASMKEIVLHTEGT